MTQQRPTGDPSSATSPADSTPHRFRARRARERQGLLASGVPRAVAALHYASPLTTRTWGQAAGPGSPLGDYPGTPSRPGGLGYRTAGPHRCPQLSNTAGRQHATAGPSSLLQELQEENGTAGSRCIRAVAALQLLLPSFTRSWGRSRSRSPTG